VSNLNGGSNPIGTLDFETDPFKVGRVPFPFACCIYFSKEDHVILWNSDSKTDFISRVVRAIKRLPACTLYAHNGGRFDFHYLLEYAEQQQIEIHNGRVMRMQIGAVTLKDSFPLMPFALEEFQKTKINYEIFEATKRNLPRNRTRIESYLLDDCSNLFSLVCGFRDVVGTKDTIGSAAFEQMRRLGIKIQSLNESHDSMFRPYFFGGRVEAFEKGIFKGPFQYLDINSAYPFAMMNNHAHGAEYAHSKKLPPIDKLGNCFLHIIATSKGALPLRDGLSLSFPHGESEFFCTGWEIAAGLKTRTLQIHKILDCWFPLGFLNFHDYVKTFFALRQQAKKSGDAIKRLAYKYLLNAGYGKFAQNPRDFREYCIAPLGKCIYGFDWESDFGEISIWSKPSFQGFGFFDVATSASITGFVRAMLWKAICASSRVLYADTDSLLCSHSSVPMGNALGQWKLEGVVKRAAIAGKKLYGVEWQKPQDSHNYKIASKGARLSWSEILQLCAGNEIIWTNEAPTFSITGTHFVTRRINAT